MVLWTCLIAHQCLSLERYREIRKHRQRHDLVRRRSLYLSAASSRTYSAHITSGDCCARREVKAIDVHGWSDACRRRRKLLDDGCNFGLRRHRCGLRQRSYRITRPFTGSIRQELLHLKEAAGLNDPEKKNTQGQ